MLCMQLQTILQADFYTEFACNKTYITFYLFQSEYTECLKIFSGDGGSQYMFFNVLKYISYVSYIMIPKLRTLHGWVCNLKGQYVSRVHNQSKRGSISPGEPLTAANFSCH